MKIFFISDIHGSIYYLKKVLHRYDIEKGDYIVILGDELNHGPRNELPKEYDPKTVAETLNEYSKKIIAVRGNCDSEVDEMLLTYPMMDTFSTMFYNNKRLFLTHGHIYNKDNLPSISSGDVLIYGHTHVPLAEKVKGIYIINPGSISIPKENNPNSYGVLQDDLFEIKDLDGNTFMKIEINN